MEYLPPTIGGGTPRIQIFRLPESNGNAVERFVSLYGSQDPSYLRRLRQLKNDQDYLAKAYTPDDRLGLFTPEWTSQPDWFYSPHYWRSFIPLAPEQGPIPYPLGDVLPMNRIQQAYEVQPGRYQVEESRILSRLLQQVKNVVDDIRNCTFFVDGSAYPPACDPHLAHHRFRSEADALAASRAIVRSILDGLGFVYYHQSIHGHVLDELPQSSRDDIRSWDLARFAKRGVIYDLARDWPHMNLRLLILHEVPVTYLFNQIAAAETRFKQLDPDLITAFLQAQQAHGVTGPHLAADSIDAWRKELPVLSKFDFHFQRILQPPTQPILPTNDLPPDAAYYICDFQGWKRRKLPPPTRFYFSRIYHHQKFGSDGEGLIFVFWRWMPRIDAMDMLDTIKRLGMIEIPKYEGDLSDEGTMRIRARYANTHAPCCGEVFSFRSGKRLHAGFSGYAQLSQLDKANLSAIGTHSRFIADDLDRYPSRVDGQAWLDDDGSHSFGASSYYTAKDFDNTANPTPHWEDDSSLDREFRRLRNRRSIIYIRGYAFEPENSENHDPRYDTDDYDDLDDGHGDDMEEGPLTAWGALKEIGRNFTTKDGGWEVPATLQWAPKLIENGVLVVEDAGSMARLRYWAGVDGLPTIQAVLTLAIAKCIPITIAIPQSSLAVFKPIALPGIGKMLENPVDQASEVEPEHLHRGLTPVEARTRWLRSVRLLLSRPEARGFVGKGGQVAWIARYLASDSLVQSFMEGPSYAVSWCNRGAVDEVNTDLTWDRVSEKQVDVLLGVAREHGSNASGLEHASIWPTNKILEDFCTPWHGEWNAAMEEIFRVLSTEIQTNGAILRNRAEWQTYLSHAESSLDLFHVPHPEPDCGKYLKTRIEAGTGAAWNRVRLQDIVVPGELNA